MTHVDVRSPVQYAKLPAGGNDIAAWSLREVSPPEPPKPRLLDRVRQALRARHMSRRTEEAYVAWIRRFIFFHNKRHPAEMGAPEVTRFLTSLAVDGHVAASTQNQALSGLLFLYRDVLEIDLPWLDGIVRAKRPERLPVVLTRNEVRAMLQRLDGVPSLMAGLLYGALRVLECCRLRVSTSPPARSSSAAARVTRIALRCCRPWPRPISPSICMRCGPTRAISPRAPAGWSCRRRWLGSIRTRAGSGCGSGCFPPPGSIGMGSPASAAAITCTSRSCSGP
jgi:hypothetical protein